MGTTLTVAYSVGLDLIAFHVGDSRAYVLRDGHLTQLTRDQTVAQALADAGKIPAEDVASHDLRHVLTQAIGAESGEATATARQVCLADGDRLLLCTDGLSDLASNDEIADELNRAPSPQAACDALVKLALDRGGRDNVTVIAAFYSISDTPST
jgi:protein phosphatase